ncbi:TlpA family protein disulfide reductase [Nonlabens ponticola]|uniref:Thioredoxin domain-containing protein n=1 Tax=Nonlabens ponticola TaxID=2496866 RepID=A0A3S9MXV1_9FLAO|nr:hypothetical protein [Nonlabens ponticola]AZQ43967.1 hypothetical protein EJ995_06870 [Nonlabens ponticola]
MRIMFKLSRKLTSYRHLYLLLWCAALSITSCNSPTETKTIIKGKVVNPEVSYVVLTDYATVNDTIKLDEKGIFDISYKNADEGFYTIGYPGEYQSFFLAPGDSLRLRFNTKEFDESLSFTGDHARENSYLLDLFLDMERSNMEFLSIINDDPQTFYDKVKQVQNQRQEALQRSAEKYNFNDHFTALTDFVIKLNSYYKLEQYPLNRDQNIYLDNSQSLPEEFFSHRDRVELGNPKLLNNFAFSPYINALISNKAFEKVSNETNADVDLTSYTFHQQRIEVMDDLIEDRFTKNHLAATEIKNFIRTRKNAVEINKLVTDFLAVSTDRNLNAEVTQMAATYIDLDPGNMLPDFDLRGMTNESINLSNEVDGLSVIYYWSINDEEYALEIHDQVKNLQIKYPEIEFIGINIDNISYEEWKGYIQNYGFNNSLEYQIVDKTSVNSQLALRNNHRSMVINDDLTIIDPSINLFYYKIETVLLGYINR